MAISPCSRCGSVCNCRIVDCNGIAIPGSGSFDDPYVIPCDVPWLGVAGPGIAITPGDNPAGSPGNGHQPTLAVCLSADADNGLGFGTDNCLYMVEAAAETPWTGIGAGLVTITPGGVAGHAPTITVTCEAVQDCVGSMLGVMTGFDYNDALNRWVTTGALGQIAFINALGDMSWMNPAAAGLITAVDTPTVDMTVVANVVSAQVVLGCGLTSSGGTTAVRVNTSGTFGVGPLAFPCADSNGAPIYCDASGQLRTVPEHTSRNSGRPMNGVLLGPVGTGATIAAGVAWNIVNPSTCRPMNWTAGSNYTGAGTNAVAAGPGDARGQASATLNGGAVQNFYAGTFDPVNGQGKVTGDAGIFYAIDDVGQIPPGGVLNYQAIMSLTNFGVPAALAVSVASCGLGVTQ